jgi:two-component system chemotaxis response regulator CheY
MEKSVLIIEASPVIRGVLGFLLESDGWIVETATNGIEGLEKIHSNPYHLAIVSTDSPKIHGYEWVREVRKMESCKNLPVLLLTKGENIDIHEKLEFDPLYFLDLVEPEQLIFRISEIFRKVPQ